MGKTYPQKYTRRMLTVGIIMIILISWGIIGSSQVAKMGNTCDLGINDKGSAFCWKWHQNVAGEIKEKFEDLGDN